MPGVTEPDDVLPLGTVIGEGLAVAGRPAGRRAVREWLADRDAEALRGTRLDQVPAALRTRVLTEPGRRPP
ncbi:hypothetical protein GCM10025868_23870 [Angustibacter aerolatus]|uniref:Uncharacterized protein n=1 Tax=Angustibacter aerolatus TaxID=1162965 RepID=A0ABQ6JJU2_9ACTN|nr:hypothetical protein GCM10025868_23870 [Angustibacter aerolatus]